mmetsp:Transcript_29902/g.85299  ORF Transcript_29902/g.85299 Transcript_29902/m.85299 type:complete len:289 (-) Transcript_29902:46-912(-)
MHGTVQSRNRLVPASNRHLLPHHPRRARSAHIQALHACQGHLEVIAVMEAADDEGGAVRHGGRKVTTRLLHRRAINECGGTIFAGIEDAHPGLRLPTIVVAAENIDLAPIGEGGVVCGRVLVLPRQGAPCARHRVVDVDLLHHRIRAILAAEEVDFAADLGRRMAIAATRRIWQRLVLIRLRVVGRELAGDRRRHASAACVARVLRGGRPDLVHRAPTDEVDGIPHRGCRHVTALHRHRRLREPLVRVGLAAEQHVPGGIRAPEALGERQRRCDGTQHGGGESAGGGR